MSTTALVINALLGTEQLSAEVFDTVSNVAKVASIIQSRRLTLQISFQLWRLNKTLKDVVYDLNEAIAGRRVVDPNVQVTPAQIQSMIDNLHHIHRMLDYIYECSRRAGLTNNSRAAVPLRTIQVHSEALKDVADWFEVAAHPEYINAIFDRTKRERESGELFDLPQAE